MSDILKHIDAGVMTLTFNRLDKKNSITSDMYAALADGIEQARNDALVRVVVIQGHETIFSAGNDIGDFLNKPPSTQESPVFRFLRGIATFEKPLIAAVAGPAVGIGTTLLFHCDLVYAGDNAAFSLPFVNLGLVPEAGSSLLLARAASHPRAAEKLLLGDVFNCQEAEALGLLTLKLDCFLVHRGLVDFRMAFNRHLNRAFQVYALCMRCARHGEQQGRRGRKHQLCFYALFHDLTPNQLPRFCARISTRRFAGSRTPSAVSTLGWPSPFATTVMSPRGTPSRSSAAAILSARRCESFAL